MSLFFHVDLDAFFASAEVLDNPSLKGLPIIVGAYPGHRGVVSTCSYEARAYGVHSAMPISEAVKLCPCGFFLPVRINRYAELSTKVMNIFEQFTPDVIKVSIDEASLDMTGTTRLWGSAFDAASKLKKTVNEKTGLTISVGAASNRYVAKIASGIKKPDGLVVVPNGEEALFMKTLPLKDLWGAGSKTREKLEYYGINSIEKLLSVSLENLISVMGNSGGQFLYNAARGIDSGIYNSEQKTKSISSEITFDKDIANEDFLINRVLYLSEELFARLIANPKEKSKPNCVTIKLRYSNFETVSSRITSSESLFCSKDVYKIAVSLFSKKWTRNPIRLIGLSLSGFSDEKIQNSLFSFENQKLEKLEKVVFSTNKKMLGKITRASLLKQESLDN